MRSLAVVGVAAALVATVIATAGGQTPQGRTLVLIELTKGATFGSVDNPPKSTLTHERQPQRLSVGDLEVFSLPVADQQGHRHGRLDGQCVATRPGTPRVHEEFCTAAFRLNDGRISLATAQIGESSTFVAAVTGGTGAYEGARGTLTSIMSKSGRSTDTLHLLP